MSKIYKVSMLLRVPDEISQGNVEAWIGEFLVKHDAFASNIKIEFKRSIQ